MLFRMLLVSSVMPKIEEGFPLIRNFTSELPLMDTEPSASTLTEGALLRTSWREPPFAIRS